MALSVRELDDLLASAEAAGATEMIALCKIAQGWNTPASIVAAKAVGAKWATKAGALLDKGVTSVKAREEIAARLTRQQEPPPKPSKTSKPAKSAPKPPAD